MPAAVTDLTRPGSNNLGGDEWELFLKKWSGEILTQFHDSNVMRPLHRVRTLKNGKSAQFPVFGTASASYHVPGENLLDPANGYLSQIRVGEKLIHVDNAIQSSCFVASIDELVSHYEYRSPFTRELSVALSDQYDGDCAITAVLTARTAAAISGINGGGTITKAFRAGGSIGSTEADLWIDGLYEAAQTLDEKNVSKMGRVCVVPYDVAYRLARLKPDFLINRDYTSGNGDTKKGTVMEVGGIKLIATNHLPSTNIASSPAGANNTYHGDFTKTVGIVFQREAFGSLDILGISLETAYLIQHQGTLIVSKMVTGHAPLRPECAIELLIP